MAEATNYLPLLKYRPYHLLVTDKAPHVVVDGAAQEGTVLTLSHWPGSATPAAYRADLSAEMAFKFIEDPEDLTCSLATNNHFDEDGLVSLFALTCPQAALELKDSLIDVASAGDFGVFKDRDMARVSFVVNAWTQAETSPLNNQVFAKSYDEIASILYEELLPRLPRIISRIDSFYDYWREEDDFLSATEAAYEAGKIELEEVPERDLLIVRIESGLPPRGKLERAASFVSRVLHPLFLHNKSDRMRILVIKGRRMEFYYRYETWVEYVSRKLAPRICLSALSVHLNTIEGRRGLWQFNGTDEIIARLSLKDGMDTTLTEGRFLESLYSFLDNAHE